MIGISPTFTAAKLGGNGYVWVHTFETNESGHGETIWYPVSLESRW